MITQIIKRTDEQISKVRKKTNADRLSFHYSNTNKEEIKYLFGLLVFRALLSKENLQLIFLMTDLIILFENKAPLYYRRRELIAKDETLQNFTPTQK